MLTRMMHLYARPLGENRHIPSGLILSENERV